MPPMAGSVSAKPAAGSRLPSSVLPPAGPAQGRKRRGEAGGGEPSPLLDHPTGDHGLHAIRDPAAKDLARLAEAHHDQPEGGNRGRPATHGAPLPGAALRAPPRRALQSPDDTHAIVRMEAVGGNG